MDLYIGLIIFTLVMAGSIIFKYSMILALLIGLGIFLYLGTSFGVAGTVGVIFMALARSGGVNPVVTAGVLMSGTYFGDRTSPVSSSANLVAGITGTKVYDNVKMMKKREPCFIVTLIKQGFCVRLYVI